MTVRELIELLRSTPQDAPVYCCWSEAEEGDLSVPWEAFSTRVAVARDHPSGFCVFIEDAP